MTRIPALFISHGAPSVVIDDSPARRFLSGLGRALPRPAAILVVSAHHEADAVEVTADAFPETIHDFGGFPEALYRMRYPAPGAPALSKRIAAALAEAGFPARLREGRGLDHGAWTPLMMLYPEAGIPVVQVSIDASRSPAWHYRLGRGLAPFRNEGALVIGSGALTHDLRAFFAGRYALDAPAPDWVRAFADWVAAQVEGNEVALALDAVSQGPYGRRNHPTPEHLLPLFVAMGAGSGEPGLRLHASTTYGVLAMDVFGFGEGLAALRDRPPAGPRAPAPAPAA